jgi:hypothetical protein
MEKNKKKQDKSGENPPVREGQEDSSILSDNDKITDNAYPHPGVKEKQADNQPEFIDKQSNRKEKK